jgi:hypothetical protein
MYPIKFGVYMSDYHLSFQYNETSVSFDLFASGVSEGKKVKLGGREFVLSVDEPDSEKNAAIDQLFKIAARQKINEPRNLKQISTIKKFTCSKKVQIVSLGNEGSIRRLATKISNLVLAIINTIILPSLLLYYTLASLIHKITKPAVKSAIHCELDLCEVQLKDGNIQSQKKLEQFGFSAGEWDACKREALSESLIVSTPIGYTVHFTKTEVEALQILYNKRANLNMLTDAEKSAVVRLLAISAGNMGFNKRIALLKQAFSEKDDFAKILEALYEFSFKTQKIEELKLLALRLEAIEPKIAELESDLPECEKLSLSDFRQADSFMSLQEDVFEMIFIKRLALWKSIEDSPLNDIDCEIKKVKKTIDAINLRYNQESDCRAGDIVLENIDDKKSYDNRAFDITEIFDWMALIQQAVFRRQFSHASIGLETKTKDSQEFRVAEVRNDYGTANISFSTLCTFRVLRLDFERVLSQEGLSKLCKLWADKSKAQVLKAVEEKYKKNLQTFLRGEKFARYKNDVSRMCFTTFKSHNLGVRRDFQQLEKELKPPKEERQRKQVEHIFCSEFVAKVLCYTLQTLDIELRGDLGASKNTVSKEAVIRNPISEFENFEALHPERLYDLVSQCASQVEHPEFTRYILRR